MDIILSEDEKFNVQGGKGYTINGEPLVVDPSVEGTGKAADAAKVYQRVKYLGGLGADALSAANEANGLVQGIIDYELPKLLPRYPFSSVGIVDGVVTVEPYMNMELTSEGEAFVVTVGGRNGGLNMRDCVLVVVCRYNTVPTIRWSSNFHPRTDAETDFACVAGGVRNVYWISEYARDEFVVAGWQETEGGGTSNGGAQ